MSFSDYVKNSIGTGVIALVGWAYHKQDALRKEVNDHDTAIAVLQTRHEDLTTLINTRFDSTDGRLGRIEKALNGRLKE